MAAKGMTRLILAIFHLLCYQLAVRCIQPYHDTPTNWLEQSVTTSLVGDERYIVLILARHGLANRLRSAADWHHIAAISGRTLLIAWTPTNDCNALFSDLFESGPKKMRILPVVLPLAGNEAIRYLENVAIAGNLSYLSLTAENMWAETHGSFVLDRSIFMSDTKVSSSLNPLSCNVGFKRVEAGLDFQSSSQHLIYLFNVVCSYCAGDIHNIRRGSHIRRHQVSALLLLEICILPVPSSCEAGGRYGR